MPTRTFSIPTRSATLRAMESTVSIVVRRRLRSDLEARRSVSIGRGGGYGRSRRTHAIQLREGETAVEGRLQVPVVAHEDERGTRLRTDLEEEVDEAGAAIRVERRGRLVGDHE